MAQMKQDLTQSTVRSMNIHVRAVSNHDTHENDCILTMANTMAVIEKSNSDMSGLS